MNLSPSTWQFCLKNQRRTRLKYKKLKTKKILKKQTSLKELKTLRVWITPQRSGALVFRLSEQLNFIKNPFSINFIYGAFGSIRFDLFGIQKDRLLEENSNYTNTINFHLAEYKRTLEGKVPIELLIIHKGKNNLVFKSEINEKSIPILYSGLKTAYFSSVFKWASTALISLFKELQKNIDMQIEIVLGKESARGKTEIEKVKKTAETKKIPSFYDSFKKKLFSPTLSN